jgi:ribonuclease HII
LPPKREVLHLIHCGLAENRPALQDNIMSRIRADSPLLIPVLPSKPAAPDFSFEMGLMAKGCRHVAGVDEAGRGPLAGPVVVSAVILDPARIPDGLNDSKQLKPATRQALHDQILANALAVSIVSVNAETIDQLNILAATMQAMREALAALALAPDHALIDGNRLPTGLFCAATTIISGDALSSSIAAASIIAKVTRDRMMQMADGARPDFGFAAHKGYGSSARHLDALARHGGVPRLHRFSFAPLKNIKGAPVVTDAPEL